MNPPSERNRALLLHLGSCSLASAWLFQGSAAISPHPYWGTVLFLLGAAIVSVALPSPPFIARERPRRVALAAVLFLAAIPAFELPSPYAALVMATVVSGAAWLALAPKRDEVSRRLIRVGVVLAVCALQAAISLAVAMFQMQHIELPVIAKLSSVCLSVLGYTAGSERSTLLLNYAEGLHGFKSTFEKLAIPFFAHYLAAGWLLRSTGLGLRLGVAALLACAFAVVRFALVAAASAHAGGELQVFCEPLPLLLSIGLFPFVVWRFATPARVDRARHPRVHTRLVPLLPFTVLAGVVFAWGLCGFDPGRAKPGRVVIDNAHGNWEDTKVAFDRVSFGTYSVYAYSELARVLGHYYTVETVDSGLLTRDELAACDVLILKTPVQPFATTEIAAIHEFVRSGGGLLLLGDHTNFLAVNAHLNDVCEPLGIEFRGDQALTPYSAELFVFRAPSPILRHPVLASVDTLQTMTGCTFRLSGAAGEAVMSDAPLISEEADYGEMSFFGSGKTDGWDVCGPERLAAASTYGSGRVVALGDSTIFSNFTMHDRGRRELMLGSLEYLNRTNRLPSWHKSAAEIVGWTAFIAALALALAALWSEGRLSPLLVLICTVSIGIGVFGISRLVAYSARGPVTPMPMCNVWVDRTTAVSESTHRSCIAGLARAGLIPRVVDAADEALEDAQMVVMVRPVTPLSRTLVDRLCAYVDAGGLLLLVDDPDNASSTAAPLLRAFGMAYRDFVHSADLRKAHASPPFAALSDGGPLLLLDAAQLWARGTPYGSSAEGYAIRRPFRAIAGGTPILNLDEQAAGAFVDRGRGRFCVFTLGFAFCDRAMGDPIFSGLPSDEDREQYAVLFELVDRLQARTQPPTHDGGSFNVR